MPDKDTKNITPNISLERKAIIEKLQTRKWFENTNDSIKQEIFSLPEDYNGFITDIANRSDENANIEVIKLQELKKGNYLLLPIFEVRSTETNQTFTYEYAIPKMGGSSRFKGILFIEYEGQITHFIVKQTEKFSLDKLTYDTIGDYVQFSQNKLANLPKNVEIEIIRQLGLKDLTIKRFIDLGSFNPESSKTNIQTSLFAAIIDGNQSANIAALQHQTLHTKKFNFELEIIPIKQLREYIYKIDDSYFLGAILRLISIGVINLN